MAAIVLGLNVREAATLGMIDKTLISERSALDSSQQMFVDNNDSLFVSDDDNEIPAPVPQPNEDTSMVKPSASSFGNISHPVASNMPSPTSGFSFQQKPVEPQPASTLNPFPSFLTFNPQSNYTTPPAASLSPFAKPFSPAPSAQTLQTSQPTTTSLTPANKDQSPSIFSSPSPFAQSGHSDKEPATSAATPRKFPNVSQPPTSQTPSFSLFQNPQQSTTPSASPFGAPQTAFNAKSTQLGGSTAGQSSPSIFDVAKPSPPAESGPSLFNLGTKPALFTEKSENPPEVSKPQSFAPSVPSAAPSQPFASLFDVEKKTNGRLV